MKNDRVGDRRNDDREGAQGPASPVAATEEMKWQTSIDAAMEMTRLWKSQNDFHSRLEISHRPRDSHIPTADHLSFGSEERRMNRPQVVYFPSGRLVYFPSGVRMQFQAFSRQAAAASWLRSAYLAFFATLGYRFIYRPELDIVRTRIKSPDLKEPPSFRITLPTATEPRLLLIEAPDAFKSFAMFYQHHGVFLPRHGDTALYGRLATHPSMPVDLTVKEFPWPEGGPIFFGDRETTVERSAGEPSRSR